MLSKENQLPLNAIQTMINLITPANGTGTVYIYQKSKLLGTISYSLALVHLILFWLVWAEIECTLYGHVALSKQPINMVKLVQQSSKQVPRAYCSNIYTVGTGLETQKYVPCSIQT